MIFVERTKALKGSAGRAQRDVCTDDIDDVVGLFNLFDQGYPIVRQGGTHGQEETA